MGDATFTCHKTLSKPRDSQQHCAGAMQYLEREGRPNQLMRLAERFGDYNPEQLEPCHDLIEPAHRKLTAYGDQDEIDY